jgi:type I restriction enzyme R subunit
LAALRYQKAIREALVERLDREKLKDTPDLELIRRLAFLKAVVVVSADATNELAVITEARKEAKRWNAVENFCKPFDFDEPDKVLTGIAFLIVCDMLLTGFDAPVEQVMYIDKRLREHNLLQAIARVNRVTKNKHRGFIVDYIGLANHLMEALSIYSDQDAEDIQQGLKNRLSELPILEERYQRLLQHFRAAGVGEIEGFVTGRLTTPEADVAVVHAAVGAMQEIKRRADFEVYLNKFLQSLNLILPSRGGPFLSRPGPALRLPVANGQGAIQGRLPRHRRRRRQGQGAHQRASRRPRNKSEDSADRAIGRRFHCQRAEAFPRECRGQGQRNGACPTQALHGAL